MNNKYSLRTHYHSLCALQLALAIYDKLVSIYQKISLQISLFRLKAGGY